MDNCWPVVLTLKKRGGWSSNESIQRAKDELLAAGFIHETVKGHRPNKASWYALTCFALARHPCYDFGAVDGFVRSAYKKAEPLKKSLPRLSGT